MTGAGSAPLGRRSVVALRGSDDETLRDRARSRHPAARAQGGHLEGPLERLGPVALGITGPHPAAGAALLALRGAQRRSQAAFAAAYGLATEEVIAIESGAVDPAQVPAPVRLLTPFPALVAALRRSGRAPWAGASAAPEG